MRSEITIIGGGIAGLTTAIALKRSGIATVIFEASPEMGAVGAGLGLAANAITALERLGLKQKVIKKGRVLDSFTICDQKGKRITKTDSAKLSKRYGTDNFTIHRHELHQVLLSELDTGTIHTNKKVTGFEHQGATVCIKFQDGTEHITKYLIVADGIHSRIRSLLLPDVSVRYSGYTCWRAVIDSPHLNITGSTETWGKNGRFGIVPLANNKLYWFACLKAERNDVTCKHYTVKDLLQHFSEFHEPIPSILQQTKDEALIWNDIIDLEPIRHFAFGNIVLIGDAAHATTPNMGQGACQGIEDAVVLADEITKNISIAEAFRKFEQRRIARTHYITTTSWKIGRVAQLENRWLILLRNSLFRILPSGSNEKRLRKIYEVDF